MDNFSSFGFVYNGTYYQTVEHAYQSFDQVPPKEIYPIGKDVTLEEFDSVIPGQYSGYSHFWRANYEGMGYRTLNVGSPYYVSEDTVVVLICKIPLKYEIIEMIESRAGHIS